MFIDLDKIQEGKDIISEVPELLEMSSWRTYRGRFNRNKLAKYIITLYTFDSPLNKSKIPLAERKMKALALAGFQNGTGNIDADVMEFVHGLKSSEIVNMIHDYLRLQGELYWTEIVLTEHQLEESNKVRLTPIDYFSKDIQKFVQGAKSKLREESGPMIKDLESLYKKFYGDFDDVKNAHRKKMTTMESRAKDLLEDVQTD